jgi:carbamoyl-phosphate synthase large subunit
MPTVLVTGVGGLASQTVLRCARMAGYRTVGTDVNPYAAGLYRSDKGYLVSKEWVQYLRDLARICKIEKVDALIPGSDIELPILSKNREAFERLGVSIIIGTHNAVMISDDKYKTQEFLKQNNFPYIKSYLPEQLNDAVREVGFPLALKPRSGYGAAHFYVVSNVEEARSFIAYMRRGGWEPVLQEYLDVESEYTTGVQIATDGEILGSVCAWRRLRRGSSGDVLVDEFHEIRQYLEDVARSLETRGPLNFQSKQKDGKCFIFEINARFSGTTYIRAMAGVNEVDILIRNFLSGEKIRANPNRLVSSLFSDYLFLSHDEFGRLRSTKETGRCGVVNTSSW